MRPAHPRRIPMTRYPSRSARIVIARMAGLRPGTSPPPVRIASVPLVVLITCQRHGSSRYATNDHPESQCEHALAVWSVEAPNSVADDRLQIGCRSGCQYLDMDLSIDGDRISQSDRVAQPIDWC